jgi:hypothetical protein
MKLRHHARRSQAASATTMFQIGPRRAQIGPCRRQGTKRCSGCSGAAESSTAPGREGRLGRGPEEGPVRPRSGPSRRQGATPCAASYRSPSPPARPQRRLANFPAGPPPVADESARLLDRCGRPRGARTRRPLHRRRPALPAATSGGDERRGSGGGGRQRGRLGFRPLRRPGGGDAGAGYWSGFRNPWNPSSSPTRCESKPC